MRYKALWKDTLREIGRTKTRFLSIFAIILLGVAFFAGLSATGPVMVHTADNYFTKQNLADLHVFSTMGLEEEDEALLNELTDSTIQYTYRSDVIFEDTGMASRLFSFNREDEKDVNDYVIVDGRLPEKSGEIALDHTNSFSENYAIGDTVQIETGTADAFEDNLNETSFVVTGFVDHPMYIERINRGNTQIGTGTLSGFSVILEDDFDMPVFTDAFIRFKEMDDLDAYSSDYESGVAERAEAVEKLVEDRPIERYDALYQEIDTEIQEGYQEIDEARLELADAKEELEQARTDIEDGYAQYEEGLQDLEIEEANAREELASKRSQLVTAQNEVVGAQAQLEAASLTDPATSAELARQAEEIQAGLQQLNQAESELNTELEAGRRELESARVELEEAEEELAEGEAEFEEERLTAEEEIVEAESDLADAETELTDLEAPEYFVEDRSSFAGYSEFEDNAQRISNIARIFPVFFFLLAALISLTTMTRMVDEERNQIGTLKALGYSNLAIARKYSVYAFIATFTGSILGLFLGYWLFPTIIMDAYSSLYNLTTADTQFYWSYALISIIGALLATGLSTYVSVRLSLRSNAATLLRPKAPKKGKRIFLEYVPFIWNRFTFTQKVAARNLFRYKRRMLMTVFGVAGGTALLLTGYGLSDSIGDIGDIQFGEINQYQAIVSESPNVSEEAVAALDQTLEETKELEGQLRVRQESAEAQMGEESHDVTVFVPSTSEDLEEFIVLRDLEDKHIVHDLPNEGAIITDKLAELLAVSEGDIIEIAGNESTDFEVEVTEIVEQYTQHFVYLSPEVYEKATGEEVVSNSRLIKYDGEAVDEDQLGKQLTDEEAVQGVVFVTSVETAFQDSMDSLDVVTVVLIVSAASLAFVVLYNLTNINVSERIRELSTIKVLGFFDKEVTMYVYRENLILTIMGILAGFVLGFFMHGFVLQTAEVDILRFARDISFMSYVYSFLLMFLFSSLVMIVMHFKLKKVDMVEALKTND